MTPLTVSNPQRATGDLTPAFAAAVVATAVDGRGWIGLLLGEELVATLSAGPAGAASLASVAQPALDAAAAALGLTGRGRPVAARSRRSPPASAPSSSSRP